MTAAGALIATSQLPVLADDNPAVFPNAEGSRGFPSAMQQWR